MSDLDMLREITRQLSPPAYDELAGISRKRRRHSAMAATVAVTAFVVGAVVAGAAVTGGEHSQRPIDSPSGRPSTLEWTPERIRAEGVPSDATAPTGSGLATRMYTVCDGPGCADDGGGPRESKHRALEVTRDGRTALFSVSGIGGQGPWVVVFDEDSVLVEDTAPGGTSDGPARFRLLRADGTEVALTLLDAPGPSIPGVPTVVVDDFRRHSAGMGGGEKTYVVDERARTLRPLERS